MKALWTQTHTHTHTHTILSLSLSHTHTHTQTHTHIHTHIECKENGKCKMHFCTVNEMSYFSQKCLVVTFEVANTPIQTQAHKRTHLHIFYPYRRERMQYFTNERYFISFDFLFYLECRLKDTIIH